MGCIAAHRTDAFLALGIRFVGGVCQRHLPHRAGRYGAHVGAGPVRPGHVVGRRERLDPGVPAMSARPMLSAEGNACRPRLIYSAGFDLVTLAASERDALTAHCRSLAAMRTSIGWGTLGELYTVPAFGQADFSTDHVVAARIGEGPIIATAQVHRVSRLLAWGELWYTAWPGDWA